MKDYTNSDMLHAINEHIHSKRDRYILVKYYIDGESAYDLANDGSMPGKRIEQRQIERILKKSLMTLSDYI